MSQNLKQDDVFGATATQAYDILGMTMRNFVLARWAMLFGQFIFIILMGHFDNLLVLSIWATAVFFNAYYWSISGSLSAFSQNQGLLQLGFDVVHLSCLLWALGGTANPMVSFYFVAVCVSALVLNKQYSLIIYSLVALGCGLVGRLSGDNILFWAALMLSMGVLWFYLYSIGHDLQKRYFAMKAAQTALASEERLAALGALSTAAAHELGTPLGTITLAAKEAMADMDEDNPYREDMAVIAQEALRCREILKHLSSTHADEREDLLRRLPIEALVQLAIDNHATHDREIVVNLIGFKGKDASDDDAKQPMVSNKPEIIHGIGNFIENAVGFSNQTIKLEISWNKDIIHLAIIDDGPGFDQSVVEKLGEPYISNRSQNEGADDGTAGGLGLGVFIAKTLIERTGGKVSFRNAMVGGAQVDIIWPRSVFEDIGKKNEDAGGIPWELQ